MILKLAVKVSKLGANRRSTGFRMTFASILFTKICVISLSLQKLTTQDIPKKHIAEHWDYASSFSLARNLMECFHTLFYLCFDDILEEERITRKNIFNLHDIKAREQLFTLMTALSDEEVKQNNHSECLEYIMEELKCDTHFQTLEPSDKKQYISGKKAFMMSREDIEIRSGGDKDTFKMWYKLLSANTHSYPLGFFHMIWGTRGTGVRSATEEQYTAMALNISEYYLIQSVRGMVKIIYPDILDKLSPREKKLVDLNNQI
ncbi:hypothetical protein FHQ22_12530 [Pasteurellaceae bacterium Phil31]|nr:hypothetical protein FHQ22_12530 [Pasteurellaceae bacterium Phil31]